MAIEMFAIFVTISEIFSGNVHNLDLDLYNWLWLNVNIPIEMPYATFYVKLQCALSDTTCKINVVYVIRFLDLKKLSRPLTILMKIGKRTYFVNVCWCEKCISRFSRLFSVFVVYM